MQLHRGPSDKQSVANILHMLPLEMLMLPTVHPADGQTHTAFSPPFSGITHTNRIHRQDTLFHREGGDKLQLTD